MDGKAAILSMIRKSEDLLRLLNYRNPMEKGFNIALELHMLKPFFFGKILHLTILGGYTDEKRMRR
jgi:hypothetical protein